MLQNKCARSIQEQIYTIESKFSPTSSFLTVTTFCHSGVFLQSTTEPIQMIFQMYNTKTCTKECDYLLIQQASSISNNNNLTSQNFDSFYDKKYFFRTLRILSCCNFLVTFLSKRHLQKLMLMLLLCLHSILFEIVHNLSFCDNCVDLIDL